jgi:1-acyl-sn-glycerol-3-phosphate acyltransferase
MFKETGQPCVPVATNAGVFWPKRGFYRKPGVAIVEFLPPIAPGMKLVDFMAKLEADVEARSDALMAEAGFRG